MHARIRRLARPVLAALVSAATGLAGAADLNIKGPAVKAPAVQSSAKTYDYIARTRRRAAEQGTVSAAGIRWRCEARECTTSGPWPTPGVEACRALAGKVGAIASYGHSANKLSSEQLTECNRGVAARKAMPPTRRADPDRRIQRSVPSSGDSGSSAATGDAHGDLTSDTFERRKRDKGVLRQQGRVPTDDAANGSARMRLEDERRARLETIGPVGSADDGFENDARSPGMPSGSEGAKPLIDRDAGKDLGDSLSRDDALGDRADITDKATALPAGGFLPDVPVPEGEGPERDTLPGGFGDARERAAEAAHPDGPVITGIDEYDAGRSCTMPRTITLRGRDFGDVQRDRQVMLAWSDDARGRERPFTSAEVRRWSDNEIVVDLPRKNVLGRGAVHYIGVWDGGGDLVSNLESNDLCHQRHVVRGRIELENCNADPVNDVTITVHDDTEGHTFEAPVTRVPGDDMAAQYELTLGHPASLRVTAEMTSRRCPSGEWQPVKTATVSLSQHTPEVERGFKYRIDRHTARLPLRLVLGMINQKFRGTRVTVHNYAGGPPDGGSYLERDASFMELGEGLGGDKYVFTVPEQRTGRRRYYVRDIHSQGDPRVSADGDAVKLTMNFESAGGEIKGHCRVHGGVLGWRDCPLGADKGAPDGNIDNMRWDIRLAPIVFDNSVAFEVLGVEMDADIQAGGICKVGSNVGSDRDVCSVLTHYRSQITNGAETAVRDELSREHVRQKVADAFRESLATLHRISEAEYPVRKLLDVRLEDGDLVLEYWPGEA